jgi:hypothetical protein
MGGGVFVWCRVVSRGVVWCGVVWCRVVWCRVWMHACVRACVRACVGCVSPSTRSVLGGWCASRQVLCTSSSGTECRWPRTPTHTCCPATGPCASGCHCSRRRPPGACQTRQTWRTAAAALHSNAATRPRMGMYAPACAGSGFVAVLGTQCTSCAGPWCPRTCASRRRALTARWCGCARAHCQPQRPVVRCPAWCLSTRVAGHTALQFSAERWACTQHMHAWHIHDHAAHR